MAESQRPENDNSLEEHSIDEKIMNLLDLAGVNSVIRMVSDNFPNGGGLALEQSYALKSVTVKFVSLQDRPNE